jgi:hypothetical protein
LQRVDCRKCHWTLSCPCNCWGHTAIAIP